MKYALVVVAVVAGSALLSTGVRAAEPQTRGFGLVKKVDAPETVGQGTYRALLIGNNEYKAELWPSLATAIRDVEALSAVLTERYGFDKKHVRLIRNGTRREMLHGLIELAEQTGPDDSVLIYYGGHGEYDKNGRGWWVPVDALDPADYIPNDDLLARLRNIKVRHKLLVSDSCFSGNLLTRGANLSPAVDAPLSGYFLEKSKLASAQGFSSGGNEPVSDGGPEWNGHSVFAYHLIAALKANQKRYVSASLLGHQLTEVVANDTATVTGTGQTPIVSAIKNQGDQGGEFFFVPTDIAAREPISVVVFNTVPRTTGIAVELGRVRAYLNQAVIEQMQKQMLTPLGEVQLLASNNVEEELAGKLKGSTAKGALVISLAGDAKQQATMFWQGLTRLELHLQAYRYANNRVTRVASHDVTAQQYPVRRWSDDPARLEESFLKNAEKVVEKWSRPQLNAFLVQFEEQR